MDDAVVVGELEGVADLGDDGQGLAGGEAAAVDEVAQGDAVHELHEQIKIAAGLAEVVDGDDVRVVEAGQGLGLAGEALGEGGVGAALGGEELEGDEAAEGFLAGLVNHAHAAAAEAGKDLQLGEMRGDLLDRGRGGGGRGGFGKVGLGAEVGGHEAGGAETGRGVGREDGVATRAAAGGGGVGGGIGGGHAW